jgi:hypothetical protein
VADRSYAEARACVGSFAAEIAPRLRSNYIGPAEKFYFTILGGSRKKIEKKITPKVPIKRNV